MFTLFQIFTTYAALALHPYNHGTAGFEQLEAPLPIWRYSRIWAKKISNKPKNKLKRTHISSKNTIITIKTYLRSPKMKH